MLKTSSGSMLIKNITINSRQTQKLGEKLAKEILELPLPKMDLESGLGSSMAKRVEKLLKPYLVKAKPIPHNVDAEVESIIARLFGISKEDYARIYTTLNNVEELLPIKALKQIPIDAIFPG